MSSKIGIRLVLGVGLSILAASSFADLTLARNKACMSCHSLDKKVVGPSFQDIAIKYQSNPNAVKIGVTAITKGVKGNWGTVAMPPNKMATAAEAETLAKWVMSLKTKDAVKSALKPQLDGKFKEVKHK